MPVVQTARRSRTCVPHIQKGDFDECSSILAPDHRCRCCFLALSIFSSAGFAADRKKIALVQINQEALFFIQMNQAARAAAKAAGVDLVIHNANNEPSAQTNAIEPYIQQEVAAILVAAIHVTGIKPAISEARKAGIPVVTIDAIVDGDNAAQVGVDN